MRPAAARWWLPALLALVAQTAHGAHCSASAVGVAFGTYNVFNTADLNSTGSVTVNCNQSSTTFSIALSAGAGTFASRALKNGTAVLSYNLFTDAQRLTIWGDGTAGTVTVSGSGTSASFTVYGKIPARQNVSAGSYGDTIVVTVTY